MAGQSGRGHIYGLSWDSQPGISASGTEEERASLSGNLADLHLDNGTLTRVTIKKERISGKVLSVTDTYIEIEGMARFPYRPVSTSTKHMGNLRFWGLRTFWWAMTCRNLWRPEGELCAALLEREFDARTIRVLLMDTGFHSLFHAQADLTVNCAAALEYENEKGEIVSRPAGSRGKIYRFCREMSVWRMGASPLLRSRRRGLRSAPLSAAREIPHTAEAWRFGKPGRD